MLEQVSSASLGTTLSKYYEGTVAAATQSSIGNVAAGGVFATLQSAGAGGAGLAAVNGVVQIGGGVITTIGSGITFCKSKL